LNPQELHVVASAARAGAGHLVKATSKAPADSPIARRRWQAEIEAGLAAAGIPHTLLRSNAYMQNVLALAPAIATTSTFGSAAGQGRSGPVEARDVAAVAAEIITSPAAHTGKTYWLTGPELLSNYDVAAVLSKLLGRTITYRELTFEQNKDAMIRAGIPGQIAEMNAQAFSLTADGDAEWVTQDVPSLLGRPPAPSRSSPPTTPPRSPRQGTGHHGHAVGRRAPVLADIPAPKRQRQALARTGQLVQVGVCRISVQREARTPAKLLRCISGRAGACLTVAVGSASQDRTSREARRRPRVSRPRVYQRATGPIQHRRRSE
jgi:hypothetical protein